MRKGDVTRAAILEAALHIARRDGLEGLTIGALADQLRMSKSGVFAHFGSRQDLQLAVLGEYARLFLADVLAPAVREPRGLPRLRALLENWLRVLGRELEEGCLMIAGASEYDDRAGSLHDAMVHIVTGWKNELLRAIEQARDEGHLASDLDAEQLVFEIYGLMLVAHHDARLLRSRDSLKRARAGLARLLDSFGTAAGKKSLQVARPPAAPKAQAQPRPGRAKGAAGARPLLLKKGRSPGRPKTDPPTSAKRVHLRPEGSRTRASGD
ncbi:MAG: TetR family transcriptional regulator [Burkholderiales bacterium]|nr:TetR family transcriptional regulator [Burkholderiales bacterium]MCA3214152.1 TetR family transcriptional regulator [Burkholderiales bacterium]MCA3226901.1 TetR family transcriptional regulator [Burkholderiales bacterium]